MPCFGSLNKAILIVIYSRFMGKVMIPLGSMISGAKEKKETLTLNDKNGQPTQVYIRIFLV